MNPAHFLTPSALCFGLSVALLCLACGLFDRLSYDARDRICAAASAFFGFSLMGAIIFGFGFVFGIGYEVLKH